MQGSASKSTKAADKAIKKRVEARCRVCGCTQYDACWNGCGWAAGRGDICTNCAEITRALADYSDVVRKFNRAAIEREVGRLIGDQPIPYTLAVRK